MLHKCHNDTEANIYGETIMHCLTHQCLYMFQIKQIIICRKIRLGCVGRVQLLVFAGARSRPSKFECLNCNLLQIKRKKLSDLRSLSCAKNMFYLTGIQNSKREYFAANTL